VTQIDYWVGIGDDGGTKSPQRPAEIRMQITVDPATVYRNVRRSLTDFDERVAARYWDAEAPVRTSFRQLLRSLDELAGRLLGDEQLSGHNQDQKGQTGSPLELTAPEPAAPEPTTPEPTTPEPATPEPTATSQPDAPDPAPALVQVTFSLPGEVGAGTVVLCGEFDRWSAEGIPLTRGSDGTWRTTVALEPGRSYRFRYLLDGERWENAWDADQYLPNGFGGTDSVIVVGPSSSQ
jgi:hypothetical protein